MRDLQISRWAPVGGIIFVILAIIGLILLTDTPDPDASDTDIARYLGDSGAHVRNIIGFYLWAIAGGAFLWFLAHLRGTFRTAEGEPDTLSTLVFAGGLVFIGLFVAAGAAMATVPGAVELGNTTNPSPDFVRMFPQLGFGMLLVGGSFAAIVMLIASSLLVLKTAVLPAWTAWLGLVAAVLLLFAALFFPMAALLIWVLAVAIVLLMQHSDAEAPA